MSPRRYANGSRRRRDGSFSGAVSSFSATGQTDEWCGHGHESHESAVRCAMDRAGAEAAVAEGRLF